MGKVSPDELVHGDHIYSYRRLYSYSHHGIYVGEGEVIHCTKTYESRPSFNLKGSCTCGFDPNKDHGVVKTCLQCFLSGQKLRRVEYGVSSKRLLLKRAGTCSTENSNEAKTVLDRAEKLLREIPLANTIWSLTTVKALLGIA
ncbi:LRAT domain [Dillenia turbinata]|uniref:LRAT domain n=1 Tax=Dillenia turbinata TaxID=194707 RepID=A0AAN8VYA3_9MAGN